MISKGLLTLAAAGVLATGAPVQAEQSTVVVEYVEITGLIDPSTSSHLLREIRNANLEGAGAMIIRLDSAGGVEAPLDELVEAISTSRTPIVVWVAPSGARAESAAFFLLEAAPIGVMSPGAWAGNWRPSDFTLQSATRRGPAALATRTVGATEALRLALIDYTAASLPEVLEGLREHPDLKGRTFIPRFHKMTSLERLQHGATRPSAAYLLLLLGAFLIIFEVYNPGVGGAAVAGGVALYFAFYGLSVLPVRWFGVGLVILGLGLLTYDLRELRLGPASVAALLAFGAGSFFAFPSFPNEVALGWLTIASGVILTLMFFIPVMTQALKARTARPIAGADKVIGTTGIARTDIAPDGQVSAGGTLWRARTLGAAIGEGSAVEIKGVSGLVLMVEESDPS